MNVLAGLLSAAFFGSADFFGGLASRRASAYSVSIVSQGIGLLLLALVFKFLPGHATLRDYLYGGLAGICGGAGLLLLYHALSIGRMGVVSPITAVLAAGVPVVMDLARGNRPTLTHGFGLALALAAVVLISASFEESGKREIATEGVREAILSGLILGGFLFFLAMRGPDAGLKPLLAARFTSITCLVIVTLVMRGDMRLPRNVLPTAALGGMLDMIGNGLYVVAADMGSLAVAAVLASLYPAATVLLAFLVLRERLTRVQFAGVVCALAGVLLIAWPS